MRFKEALKAGETVEYLILEIIRRKYPDAYKVDGKFSGYDLFVPDYGGVEVKTDTKSEETNNFVVEVEMYDKPSALSITTAKMWVFVTNEIAIYIRPEMIRKYIYTSNIRSVRFTGNGDTVPKIAYLIKVKEIEALADKICLSPLVKK